MLDDFFSADKTTVDEVLRSDGDVGRLVQPKAGTTVIDLRQAADYGRFRLPGSVNMPFVQRSTASPFADAKVFKDLWERLEDSFRAPSAELEALIRGRRVLVWHCLSAYCIPA